MVVFEKFNSYWGINKNHDLRVRPLSLCSAESFLKFQRPALHVLIQFHDFLQLQLFPERNDQRFRKGFPFGIGFHLGHKLVWQEGGDFHRMNDTIVAPIGQDSLVVPILC